MTGEKGAGCKAPPPGGVRTLRACLIIALAAGAIACADPGHGSAPVVRRLIEAHNADAEKWYAAGDVESLVTLFAEDAWQMPPNQPPLQGREAIRAFWSNAFHWGRWRFDLQTLDLVVGGAFAVERGGYSVSFSAGPGAPAGMGSFEDRGNYIVLWRREPDGAWRVVWDAPVSEVPLPAASQ